MSDEQIDFTELEKLYDGLSKSDGPHNCQHVGAITISDGVYYINCKQCGICGATSESGARALGWIE